MEEISDVTSNISNIIFQESDDGTEDTPLLNDIDQSWNERLNGDAPGNFPFFQMDRVTRLNRENVEKSMSAAEKLNAQKQTLMQMIDKLTSIVRKTQ